MTLQVSSFGGGVALVGGADTRGVDELLQADSVDLGARGAIVCAPGVADYVTLLDGIVGNPVSALHALLSTSGINYVSTLAVVEGVYTGAPAYMLVKFARTGEASTIVGGADTFDVFTRTAAGTGVGALCSVLGDGIVVTSAMVQGPQTVRFNTASAAVSVNVFFVNLGAREGTAPNTAPGLYVVVGFPASATIGLYPIAKFDALGTGPFGEYAIAAAAYGTYSKQLCFRGIASYNGYLFGWGFDADDTTNGDGPCRVMFSNVGAPLKWGNDNQTAPGVAPTDRAFTDSDAVILGAAGEIVRAGLVVFGKLFLATNRGLHFVQGFGRDSFVTNGAIPVMKAHNVVGPNALIEGPDRFMYGVGDHGLWRYNGVSVPEPLGEKLRDFNDRSVGWWDLIWTDPTRAASLPGKTNADLVWMAVDTMRQQVLVGIPWCDAASGSGPGRDTVVIKYHVRTGGFTRQVFRRVAYSAAGYFRREGQQTETRFLGTATAGQTTVQRYGDGLAARLPVIECGPYAPFGTNGHGVIRRAYVTLAWDGAAALPLVFDVATTLDDAPGDAFELTIGPTEPSSPQPGDLWCDTSESDTSVGNAYASPTVRATGGYRMRAYTDGGWMLVPGLGGQGARVTLPLPLTRRTATRVTLSLTCTAAAGRFEIEGLGWNPGDGDADA